MDSSYKERVMQSFHDVCFIFSLNKLLNEQQIDRWFETPWRSCDIILFWQRDRLVTHVGRWTRWAIFCWYLPTLLYKLKCLYSNVTELCSWTAIDTSVLFKVEIWCWSGYESLPKPKLSLQMMSNSYTIPVQRIHPLHHTWDWSESLGSRGKSMGRTFIMWYLTRLNVMEILKPICLKEKPQH